MHKRDENKKSKESLRASANVYVKVEEKSMQDKGKEMHAESELQRGVLDGEDKK